MIYCLYSIWGFSLFSSMIDTAMYFYMVENNAMIYVITKYLIRQEKRGTVFLFYENNNLG